MKHFLLMTLLCLVAGSAMAQQAIISSKKVYLKVDGKVGGSLIIPVVSPKYPALKRAMADSLIFDGRTLNEIIQAYAGHESGITNLDYEISYQNRQVISIKLNYETMGAYPDSFQKWLTFDIATGKPHLLSADLTLAGIQKIFADYKAHLKKDLKNLQSRMSGEDKAVINDIMHQLNTSIVSLKISDLDDHYLFTKMGILITSESVLPHATRALDLDRDLLIPYARLSKYRKPGAAVIR